MKKKNKNTPNTSNTNVISADRKYTAGYESVFTGFINKKQHWFENYISTPQKFVALLNMSIGFHHVSFHMKKKGTFMWAGIRLVHIKFRHQSAYYECLWYGPLPTTITNSRIHQTYNQVLKSRSATSAHTHKKKAQKESKALTESYSYHSCVSKRMLSDPSAKRKIYNSRRTVVKRTGSSTWHQRVLIAATSLKIRETASQKHVFHFRVISKRFKNHSESDRIRTPYCCPEQRNPLDFGNLLFIDETCTLPRPTLTLVEVAFQDRLWSTVAGASGQRVDEGLLCTAHRIVDVVLIE